ncbi:PBP1A family penicillin-binding protein [Paenibacillus sp. JX-17]|uniref:PBP1A family penicillin-binding protein n=1 Tax=Paenibacillus lacisoli TaxID=3064525 RepID=A0ABT9C6R8_9BACL|nr:penicillin-binding protein 1A [Paenibacillus sp. JX-17]MDO7904950.1 PBP1A family penicillin-binding protein [Paenibacillus sp. JX-17]
MSNDSLSRSGNRNNKPGKNKEKPAGNKKKKLTGKRVAWILFFTIAFAVFCGIAGYLFVVINGERMYQANKDKITVNETSKVYDRNDKLVGELSVQKSDPATEDEIPKLLKDAFVATEDKRFYEHKGVDLWSIGRAAVKDVVARSAVEGGSTITQQLAKNLFLTRDKTFFRKATEVSIAVALDRNMSKEEILTLYLNRIWFGHSYYGVKAAAEGYFGVSDLKQLKLWQIATLAAIPKGPSKYNPASNPNDSKERRGVVLQLMYEQGYITKAQMDEAKAINYQYKAPKKQQKHQAFIDYVMDEAESQYGLSGDDLNIGGYKIYTTLDVQAQTAMEKAFADDSLFEKSKDDQQVQASMVIMDHTNGGLVALMGGRDYQRGGYSRLNSRRQPGSAFKPIVSYAPALDSGEFTMDTPLSNERQSFGKYSPRNLHGYSKTISMTDAITKSENIPAVWLLNQIGVKTGVAFAEKLGIKLGPEDQSLAIALGGLSQGTNTLEMAQAFSAFGNDGQFQTAYSIRRIDDSNGKTQFEHTSDLKRVMKEKTAYEMTEMMQNVVTSGTGKKAQIDWPVAGKTGTTQSGIEGNSSNRDVWFVGYTPEWTGAVWMGYDKPDKDHLLKRSSSLSAAFFARVMQEALQGHEVTDFKKPKGLEEDEPVKEQPPQEEEPAALGTPGGLTGSYSMDTQTVSLSWNPAEGSNVLYRVYRKESSESSFTPIIDGVATTGADDQAAMAGLTYEYYVTAYSGITGEESQPSNTVSVTIDAAEVTPPPEQQEPVPGDVTTPEDGDGTYQGTVPQDNGNNGLGNGGDNSGTPNSGSGTDTGTTPPDSGNGQNNGSDTPTGGSSDTSGDDPAQGDTTGQQGISQPVTVPGTVSPEDGTTDSGTGTDAGSGNRGNGNGNGNGNGR